MMTSKERWLAAMHLKPGDRLSGRPKSADEIITKIEEALDPLPHHRGIVVTSAGVMPPVCKPETIRQVCNWAKAYHPRI